MGRLPVVPMIGVQEIVARPIVDLSVVPVIVALLFSAPAIDVPSPALRRFAVLFLADPAFADPIFEPLISVAPPPKRAVSALRLLGLVPAVMTGLPASSGNWNPCSGNYAS